MCVPWLLGIALVLGGKNCKDGPITSFICKRNAAKVRQSNTSFVPGKGFVRTVDDDWRRSALRLSGYHEICRQMAAGCSRPSSFKGSSSRSSSQQYKYVCENSKPCILPSITNSPPGKHPVYVMPHEALPVHGVGAGFYPLCTCHDMYHAEGAYCLLQRHAIPVVPGTAIVAGVRGCCRFVICSITLRERMYSIDTGHDSRLDRLLVDVMLAAS